MRRRSFSLVVLVVLAMPLTASLLKNPPPAKPTETLYKQLVCTDQHKACINEIISTMANSSKPGLLFKQSHLKALGAQINEVHPLKFLAAIFSDPYLKSCMYQIWGDFFKRNGFLNGLGPSLTREAEQGKLNQHLAGFASEVGVAPEAIRPYFDNQDWENLVLHLIHS